MASKTAQCMAALGVTIALTGCPAVDKTAAQMPPADVKSTEIKPAETKSIAKGQSYTGWYMERAGQGLFQACGKSQQMPVSGSEELRNKAREFGLQQDTPVYVRLVATQSASGEMLEVSKVEQFGSTTPVRNCGLTGVVTPEPSK